MIWAIYLFSELKLQNSQQTSLLEICKLWKNKICKLIKNTLYFRISVPNYRDDVFVGKKLPVYDTQFIIIFEDLTLTKQALSNQ